MKISSKLSKLNISFLFNLSLNSSMNDTVPGSSRPPVVPNSSRKSEVTKNTPRDDKPQMSGRLSARDENPEQGSARGSARDSARGSARDSARGSARDSARGDDSMDTFRSTMSTARVHTALAALTAEKNALEARLMKIDSTLEGEKRKGVSKVRSHRK